MSTIKKATTKVDPAFEPIVKDNTARSMVVPFDLIAKNFDIVPVRKPNKFAPDDRKVLSEIKGVTPSNDELMELAKLYPAPADWCDEDAE